MNSDKEYASDSDSSDEDFCPDEDIEKPGSEESSDDEIDDTNTGDVQEIQSPKKRKGKGEVVKTKAGTRKQNENETKRSSRHSNDAGKIDTRHNVKEEIESDDDDKARAHALWADFLGDVKQTPVEVKKTESAHKTSRTTINGDKPSVEHDKKVNSLEEAPKEVTITEVLDFAGEEIRVLKTVSADSVKENKATTSKNPVEGTRGIVAGLKRTAAPSSSSGSGGLGSLLNGIGKKKKISVLEKTKMDWKCFKKDEGIDEQLQTFNKGKDGFLERQDFLERTDLRQFEIERNLRQTRRNH